MLESNDARQWTLSELAGLVGGRAQGNGSKTVTHVADLQNATSESVCHCSTQKQIKNLQTTQAGIVILPQSFASHYAGDHLIVRNSRVAFAQIVSLLHQPDSFKPGIHQTAVVANTESVPASVAIGANAVIGENVVISDHVYIGSGTVIEDHVSIGRETRIDSNVTIYRNCRIGSNCMISSGVVLGASGFSFEWNEGHWVGVPNIGAVVIGNKVEIGACTSIDRGSIRDTQIKDGVKIDNNVQIGHNVQIGEHTLIVGNVGIAGSATIGKRCVIGGQATMADHVNITDDVVILANSMVTKTITVPGTYAGGFPACDERSWRIKLAHFNRLNRKSTARS